MSKLRIKIVTFAITGAVWATAVQSQGVTTFIDVFNRPDSTTVGNGWAVSPDTPQNPGTLVIQNGALTSGTNSLSIYRPFDYSNGGTAEVTFTRTSGFEGISNRFTDAISFFNNGTATNGLTVSFGRGDNTYDDSQVILNYNGNVVASTYSSVQFDTSIDAYVALSPTGLVTGSVTSDGQTFSFNFEQQDLTSLTANGNHFALYLGGLDAAGHFPQLEAPDGFASNLLSFISESR